jgi:hypothetical protein
LGGKRFFFEKKKQKTFIRSVRERVSCIERALALNLRITPEGLAMPARPNLVCSMPSTTKALNHEALGIVDVSLRAARVTRSRTPMSSAVTARSGTRGSTSTSLKPSRRHSISPHNCFGFTTMTVRTPEMSLVTSTSAPHSKWGDYLDIG